MPFPDRQHLSVLLASFELKLFTMIERWAYFAIDEVSRWSNTGDPGPGARTELITRILAARQSIIDHSDLMHPTAAPSHERRAQ